MKKYLPFAALALVFFLIKLNGIGVRLSDTNIYFYTAYEITQGKILYKDIFFTNFPLLPYVSVLYYYLLGRNVSLYTFTATLEVILAGFFIYKIVFKNHKRVFLATVSCAMYLFSFIILTTSDHQSGVFLASFLGVIGYYFLEQKKQVPSGIFFGFSLLTKAYFLPLFFAALVTIIVKQRKKLFYFLLGGSVAGILILLPSIIFARDEMYTNIFEYSLTRSQGLSKANILRFFVFHDALFFILFIYTLIRIKKHIFFGTLSLTGFLFIIFYKDIYYLYLNFFIPFLAIAFSDFYLSLHKRFPIQKYIIPTILGCLFLFNIYLYFSKYQNLQRLHHIEAVTQFLKNNPEEILYGPNDITPALAYLSNKKLLNGVIDTNENIYRKGYLNESLMTRDAINNKALIIAKGAYYPQFNIEDPLVGGIYDRELIVEKCEVIQSYPITTEGIENRLNIFRCDSS